MTLIKINTGWSLGRTAATSHHVFTLFGSFDQSCHVSLLGLTFSESSSFFVLFPSPVSVRLLRVCNAKWLMDLLQLTFCCNDLL